MDIDFETQSVTEGVQTLQNRTIKDLGLTSHTLLLKQPSIDGGQIVSQRSLTKEEYAGIRYEMGAKSQTRYRICVADVGSYVILDRINDRWIAHLSPNSAKPDWLDLADELSENEDPPIEPLMSVTSFDSILAGSLKDA